MLAEIEIGSKVEVRGKSLKGKTRIREHGNFWLVLMFSEQVACFRNEPGFLLESVESGEWRWTKLENDPDFELA